MNFKYLETFKRLQGKSPSIYRLNGSRILIELMPKEEIKSKGGLILSTPKEVVVGGAEQMKPTLGIVLLTGEGYYNDSGDSIPLDVKQGAIVMVNDFSLKVLSTFPGLNDYSANTLALTEENAIQLQWDSIEQYNEYIRVLNESI